MFSRNVYISVIIGLCGVLVMLRVIELSRPYNYEEPERTGVFAYTKPTDIVNNLRDNDKNFLMFGRSRDPPDAKTENSNGGEILKGYVPSSTMGEQYGYFTGMTLYSGPNMYDQEVINDVFGYTETLGTPGMSPELVDAITKYNENKSESNRRAIIDVVTRERDLTV